MADDSTSPTKSIQSLPDEVLAIILKNRVLSCFDVVHFGSTCTQFLNLIRSNQIIWKLKFRAIVPLDIFEAVNASCNGDWMEEIKLFFQLKKHIHSEILQMSPKYYRRDVELEFEDVKNFFEPAVSRSVNYFLSVYILSIIVNRGNWYMSKQNSPGRRPYNLTDLYYANIVLRFLIHNYMMIKWIRMTQLNEVEPEKIVHFFMQWLDTSHVHLEERIEDKIDKLVDRTENLLESSHPLKSASPEDRKLWAKGFIPGNMWDSENNRKVLAAVSKVVLTNMAISDNASLDTLDIAKVLRCVHLGTDVGIRPIAVGSVIRRLVARVGCHAVKGVAPPLLQPHQIGFGVPLGCEAAIHATREFAMSNPGGNDLIVKMDLKNAFNRVERDAILGKVVDTKCGNVAVVAAIFEAVSRRCGVRCDLVVFPNHLYLMWSEDYEKITSERFTINFQTGGQLDNRRQCPFATTSRHQPAKYTTLLLFQYLEKSFNECMGAVRNFYTQNCFLLLDFLGTEYSVHNPYRNFLIFLTDRMSSAAPEFEPKIRMKYMDKCYIDVMWSLANYVHKDRTVADREIKVKRHESCVKYAVGMVCYHVKYDYACVVRGWDRVCSASVDWQKRMAINTLERGPNQPFYSVIATDYSERYVAQENLREASKPNRLFHLEDVIAKDFTHFDGFAYIPNQEKQEEYPEDEPVRMVFKSREQMRAH